MKKFLPVAIILVALTLVNIAPVPAPQTVTPVANIAIKSALQLYKQYYTSPYRAIMEIKKEIATTQTVKKHKQIAVKATVKQIAPAPHIAPPAPTNEIVVVDRIENGNIAVIELPNRTTIDVAMNILPSGTKQADCLIYDTIKYSPAPAQTMERATQIKKQLNGIWSLEVDKVEEI